MFKVTLCMCVVSLCCVDYANLFLCGGCWFFIVFLYFSNDFRWFGVITIFWITWFYWAGFLRLKRFNRRFGIVLIFRFIFHGCWLLTWDFRIFSCSFFFIMLWLRLFCQRCGIACWLPICIVVWLWFRLFRFCSECFGFRFIFGCNFGGCFCFYRCFTKFIIL